MEYFFYCRDRQGSEALRSELIEAHWSFMDDYADAMIARGPTMTPDGTAATGSVHIVDLPDPDAARVFAFEEPNFKAGVYAEVSVHRFSNLLGRTMWDFTGAVAGYRRFLIIGHGRPGNAADDHAADDHAADHHGAHRGYAFTGGYRDRLIACGPLRSDDGSEWVGTATMVEVPDRATAEAVVANDPYAQAGLYEGIEVHDWQFGGRR